MRIGDYPVSGAPYWLTMTGVAASGLTPFSSLASFRLAACASPDQAVRAAGGLKLLRAGAAEGRRFLSAP